MTTIQVTRMQWYARQVANNPMLVILVVLVMTATCIIVSLTINDLPSFKDPLLGFEPRGTKLAQQLTAWRNLLESTSWDGPLTFYPGSLSTASVINVSIRAAPDPGLAEAKEGLEVAENSSSYDVVMPAFFELESEEREISVPNVSEEDAGKIVYERKSFQDEQDVLTPVRNENFFCNNPARGYSHVVVESVSEGADLFTTEALRSVCIIDETQLRTSAHFPELCEQARDQHTCCKSWSLPNYVALLQNKSSCHDINETDVRATLDLLKECSSYYHRIKLSHDCSSEPAMCRDVPKQCIDHDAVYNILHYLVDVDFLNPKAPRPSSRLRYSTVFLPTAQSTEALLYYRDLAKRTLSDGDVRVAGMEFGLKYRLFEDCLLRDAVYVALSGTLIFVLLWMYSSSLFVTFMTVMSVAFSLATAYFMYTVIYQITFFPFMNLMTVIIVIGIGADDACIYCKVWLCSKTEKNGGTLVKLVRDTLHHACLSMFVTSVTTAVAFFGSAVSSITAVRCFSIFAGTAVLANFVFTVSWLPASVILAEKWCSTTCCMCIPPLGVYFPQFQRILGGSTFCNSLWKLQFSLADSSRVFFEKILPCIVIKLRYLWIFLFTALATMAAVAVFYHPRLRLPDSKEFQIFATDHPFEKYDLVLKTQFWFEKAREREVFRKLPIRVVWGALPVDNGNYLNPFSRGSLVLDPEFDVVAKESQKWLLNFCIQLRNQSFYQSTHGPLLSNCFIETFKSWMERRCVDGITLTDRTPCCVDSGFPYSRPVFEFCIREAIEMLHNTPGFYLLPSVEGPRFSKSTGKISAVVIEYDSTFTYSNSYEDLFQFKNTVETWIDRMMQTAPREMRNGWFTSDFEFYELQDSLSRGTVVAIGVAVGVAFLAVLLTTLDLLISIYAILTIAGIIVVTVASLVLLGWQLNVLESTTVSVAIGLAVDLTLHYGVAYRLSDREDREASVIFALTRVASPVAMAAFTTFMAGALMFPSVVLAYQQTAKFLVILITVSWLYSTFFFLSLLRAFGPQRGRFQLSYPTLNCCDTTAMPAEKTVYALSESTLSSSSASYPTQIPANESHELEPLTAVHGNHMVVPKFGQKKKKQRGHRSSRPRSESFSASASRTRDPAFTVHAMSRTPRKVSLPTVNVTFHGDASPEHVVEGAASASTILCDDDEAQMIEVVETGGDRVKEDLDIESV